MSLCVDVLIYRSAGEKKIELIHPYAIVVEDRNDTLICLKNQKFGKI